MDHPLRGLCHTWLEKIRLACQFKKTHFGDDAAEAMRFFDGPYDFMYEKKYATSSSAFQLDEDAEDTPAPSFRMTVNKVAEMVQIFGPVLYHQNPNRQVNPRLPVPLPPELFVNPQDPLSVQHYQMMQAQAGQLELLSRARATLLQEYLNYTPNELDLAREARLAIDEAIIKGMAVAWVELYQPKGSQIRLVGSFWDSVDNLVIDPDFERLDDAQWVARKCCHPAWQVEREYGLAPGTLPRAAESVNRQAEVNTDPDGDYARKTGTSNDLVTYWKVYSKMGVGGRLVGADQRLKDVLEQFGDYCYLVLCENVPYPLNLPPAAQAQAGGAAAEDLLRRLEWPTPFWLDDAWPFKPLMFHEVPGKLWPMSHCKPAMGELKFLNWVYSFVAGKIRVTLRDFLACKKSLGEEIKEAILHGRDLTLLEIEQAHGTISDVVQFLQHPSMNGDVWRVIELIENNFEKRTGLSELAYGMSSRQMRSAQEAEVKQAALQVRPDDMAQKVEDWMTGLARLEAIAIRWHLKAEDVAPVLGPYAAMHWQQLVLTTDFYALVRQLDYRIEAGSTRKPNRERDAANMGQAVQTLFQPLYVYAQATGDVQPVNALITDWAKTLDMDASRYLLRPPPPPPPTPGEPGQPPGPAAGAGGGGGGRRPRVKKTVKRDDKGLISEVTEEES